MSKVTEVDSLTALAEEQEAVENLEQLGGRLVDAKSGSSSANGRLLVILNHVRADNRLASIRETPEETYDSPSTLGIQTGGRFIEEEQKTRLEIGLS